MENMATMLNEMAGGLQQSFGTVFERVGESLSQSAQMMQMMNEMMEAAMLQNLVATFEVQPETDKTEAAIPLFALRVSVENRSQIRLSEVAVRFHFAEAVTDVSSAVVLLEHVFEEGIDARSTAECSLPLSPGSIGHGGGSIQLAVRSPGTKQWLYKEVPLRIPVLKMATVEAVPQPSLCVDGMIHEWSEAVSLPALRDALGVNAFDALLTSSVGYYHVKVPAGIYGPNEASFVVSIHPTSEAAIGARILVAASITQVNDTETTVRRQCQLLKAELESLS